MVGCGRHTESRVLGGALYCANYDPVTLVYHLAASWFFPSHVTKMNEYLNATTISPWEVRPHHKLGFIELYACGSAETIPRGSSNGWAQHASSLGYFLGYVGLWLPILETIGIGSHQPTVVPGYGVQTQGGQ